MIVVREGVKNKVDQCLWIDKLRDEEVEAQARFHKHHQSSTSLFGYERCSVCTLPYGMCIHTREWIDDAQIQRENKQNKESDPLEDEINEALNLFSDGFELPPPDANDDDGADEIELQSMQWSRLEQRLSDRIGTSEYSLFAPDERGWHSCVSLKCNVMVVFGGFRYKKSAVPHPFRSHPLPVPQDMEFLNDVRIFDLLNYSWHGVTKPPVDVSEKPSDNNSNGEVRVEEKVENSLATANTDDEPRPDSRYGHVAAAIAPDQMLIFGGRGERGKIFCDTWIYHHSENRWELVCNNEMISMPVPPARYFASCSTTVEGSNVYLFGGTDGIDNFGDLWLFRADNLRWERLVAVGLPPSPRYGHCLIQVKDDVLAVVGGCSVSVQSEVVGSTIGPTETKNLIDLSNTLQKRYREENRMASVSGASLLSSIGYSALENFNEIASSSEFDNAPVELKDIYKQAANISAAFHTLESTTRVAEKNLVDTYNLSKAASQLNVQKARHPNPHVDIVFLHTKELIWKTHLYPVIKGNIPRARIHFGAVCLGQYIFVMGGAEPTGLVNRPIESRDSGRTCDFTKVYALNMANWIWEQPIPIKSTDYLTEAISIASADVIRAQRKVEDNRSRGLSFGLLNGRTVELAEAEAVLEVCKWRKQVLLREQEDFKSPPVGRWGGSLTTLGVQGQRLVYCGGWSAEEAIKPGDVVVLNMEQEHARLRRMAEEHQANIHREILEVNRRNSIEIAQSLYEMKTKAEAEVKNQQMEFARMSFEDIRSSLPPISKPPSVELVQANATTLWVRWDRITRHNFTKRDVSDPSSITYYLYIQTGFQNILKGDRVSVAPLANTSPSKRAPPDMSTVTPAHQPTRVHFLSHFADLTESFFDPSLRRFNGEVLEINKLGSFDVLFDDGLTERNVSRHRIKLSPPLLQPRSSPQRTGNADDNSVEGDDVSAITSLPSLTASLAQSQSQSEVSQMVKRRWKRKMEKQQKHLQKMSEIKQQRDVIETVATVSVMEKLKAKVGASRRSVDGSSVASSVGSLPSSPIKRGGDSRKDAGPMSRSGRSSSMGGSRQSSSRLGFSRGNTGLSSIMSDEDEFDNLSINSNDSLSVGSGENVSPTVPPPSSEWKLVYTGNETSYICEGVVSQDVLLREPDLTVPVAFLLQVHGVDYPTYELSMYSDVAILHTTAATKPLSLKPATSSSDPVDGSNIISRKKKEILSAVVLGQKIVQIERNKHLFISQGVSDEYL